MDKVTNAKGKIFEAAARGLPLFVCRSKVSRDCVAMLMYTGGNEFHLSKTGVCIFRFRIKKWIKLMTRQWEDHHKYQTPMDAAHIIAELQTYEYVKLTPHQAVEVVELYKRFL
jgi:hypothetical protein